MTLDYCLARLAVRYEVKAIIVAFILNIIASQLYFSNPVFAGLLNAIIVLSVFYISSVFISGIYKPDYSGSFPDFLSIKQNVVLFEFYLLRCIMELAEYLGFVFADNISSGVIWLAAFSLLLVGFFDLVITVLVLLSGMISHPDPDDL